LPLRRRGDRACRDDDGFTLVEAVVALAVCGVIVAATTPVVTSNLTRARSADGRLQMALAERRALDALPAHSALQAGVLQGESDGVAWRADVRPFEDRGAARGAQWAAYRIVIDLEAQDGRTSRIETLRLGRAR
jgi:prepilin-type N-terminal cleavage/methylation domain-containing protein